MNGNEYRELRQSLRIQAEVSEMLGVGREVVARRDTEATETTREAALALEALEARRKRLEPASLT